ncbi:MAG: LacI family DNA-binding transcriptional regulator [Nevskiales bacterium]
MKIRKPTIVDVARRAQVSVGTVSHVLSGAVNVSDRLRERVQQATQELGYEQNMLAHALRRQRAPVVGLCVPHVSSAYLSALIDTFEDIAAGRGYQVMQVISRRDPKTELRRVRELLGHRIAGLLLVPSIDPRKTLNVIRESGIPAILVDRPSEDRRFDQVTFDNRGIMREAVSRLIALRHQRILFVVRSRDLVISRQRIEGLEQAAAAAAKPVTAAVIEFDENPLEYTRSLSRLLTGPGAPTALVVSNSVIAAQTLRVLRALGVACPEEISLLAFEEPDWADLVTPRLSVIRQPVREIARRAWELLLRRMKGDEGPVAHIELQAEIVFRESVRKASGTRPRRRSLASAA